MRPTGALRERMLTSIHRRALHLAKITAPGHPVRGLDVVLSLAALSLLRTVLVVLGPTVVTQWSEYIFGRLVEAHGICRFCGVHPLVAEQGMCHACWQECEGEQASIERQRAMDQPPQGGIA